MTSKRARDPLSLTGVGAGVCDMLTATIPICRYNPMNDTEFHALIDEQLHQLEEVLDELEVDIDGEISAGILTLEFENGSKIIINRQEPLHQLWLATRSNGYHFDYREGQWVDSRSGQLFLDVLEAACSEQAEQPVSLRG